jgi:hypothetical protein
MHSAPNFKQAMVLLLIRFVALIVVLCELSIRLSFYLGYNIAKLWARKWFSIVQALCRLEVLAVPRLLLALSPLRVELKWQLRPCDKGVREGSFTYTNGLFEQSGLRESSDGDEDESQDPAPTVMLLASPTSPGRSGSGQLRLLRGTSGIGGCSTAQLLNKCACDLGWVAQLKALRTSLPVQQTHQNAWPTSLLELSCAVKLCGAPQSAKKRTLPRTVPDLFKFWTAWRSSPCSSSLPTQSSRWQP